MSLARRHDRDETVQRFQAPDGLHIWWRDHETGDLYGGIAPGEAGEAALRSEGVDPHQFWREIGQP
ncbi:hypothetical protein [Microbacterium sp. NPDC079995]|uniref:hypothetical protein n=1 Tax=unclassified Microbacterium TaxID=2609290 RepID=UPI00344DD1B1